ncbi:MAG TPA: prolipoprotein diacylglyceryl transferase family protein [Dehalococcoidia bacterium]|nr:prolipoprotein diacylglyceryl transferase family protein [Dehalococcoidia bacterium]
MTALALLLPLLKIEIGIDPEIGEIAGFLITWHGVFTAVGIGAGLWLALWLADKRAIDADEAYTVGLLVVIGGIIGARALYVIENWSDFEDDLGEIIAITEGGISIYGALLGGTIFGLVYAWLRPGKIPILAGGDCAAAGALIGQAIGRIGDVINGEHIAESSDLAWAVEYTHIDSPSFGLAAQHPAVAYELLGDLLILGVVLVLFFRVRRPGWGFFTWFFGYGLLRFLVSFLRQDEEVLGDLVMAQAIAIGGMAIGLAGYAWLAIRGEPAGPSRAERRRARREAEQRERASPAR